MQVAELERVRRAREGDAEAFRGIVETYSKPLWRVAWRILGDRGAAEDAVQEAFLRAWRALDRFDDRAELQTWLYRIAINAAIDVRREQRRHGAMAAALPEDLDGEVTVVSEEPDPHRRAVSGEVVRRGGSALSVAAGRSRRSSHSPSSTTAPIGCCVSSGRSATPPSSGGRSSGSASRTIHARSRRSRRSWTRTASGSERLRGRRARAPIRSSARSTARGDGRAASLPPARRAALRPFPARSP